MNAAKGGSAQTPTSMDLHDAIASRLSEMVQGEDPGKKEEAEKMARKLERRRKLRNPGKLRKMRVSRKLPVRTLDQFALYDADGYPASFEAIAEAMRADGGAGLMALVGFGTVVEPPFAASKGLFPRKKS